MERLNATTLGLCLTSAGSAVHGCPPRRAFFAKPLRSVATTTVLASALLAACGGSANSSGTPSRSPALTPVGFLPIPTQRSFEAPPTGASGPAAACSVVELMSCVKPGDVVNLYRDLQLHRVTNTGLSAALKVLNRDAVAQGLDPNRNSALDVSGTLVLSWTDDVTPTPLEAHGRFRNALVFFLHEGRGTISEKDGGVEFQVPAEFFSRLKAESASLTTVVPQTPTLEPTLALPSSIGFPTSGVVEPREGLPWDGPDKRVHSFAPLPNWIDVIYRCWPVPTRAGVPQTLQVDPGTDETSGSFDFGSVVHREAGWRRTGYSHEGWQIWQADDAFVIYLVADSAPDIAFEYNWWPPLSCD